jgi:hypothetical protein
MPTIISFLAFTFTVLSSGYSYSVTTQPNAVTFYDIAYSYPSHTIGILAHEDMAGASFYELKQGDIITLDYSRRFEVTDVLRYTATNPNSVWSSFVGVSGLAIDPVTMGQLIYNSGNTLVLQTCFDDGRGRLFIIAEPVVYRKKGVR